MLLKVLSLLLVIGHSLADVPGIPIRQSLLRIGEVRDQCRDGMRMDCRDCQNLILCNSLHTPIANITCATLNARAPYCSNGRCSAENSCNVPTAGASELCPSEGFFPNPTNCQQFNQCGADLNATPLACPGALVFNYLNGLCKVRATPADCPIVNCAFFRGRFVAYGGNSTLYWYCGTTTTSLLQCSDGEVFDGVAGCSFGCQAAGRFPVADNPRQYYLCVASGNGFQNYVQDCPTGTSFVAENGGRCLVPALTTTTTTTVAPVDPVDPVDPVVPGNGE